MKLEIVLRKFQEEVRLILSGEKYRGKTDKCRTVLKTKGTSHNEQYSVYYSVHTKHTELKTVYTDSMGIDWLL